MPLWLLCRRPAALLREALQASPAQPQLLQRLWSWRAGAAAAERSAAHAPATAEGQGASQAAEAAGHPRSFDSL